MAPMMEDLRALLPLVVLLSGCVNDYQQIELGACGNGVLDTEFGEQCESELSPPDGAVVQECAPPGDPFECRFTCRTTRQCPAGWGCGILDGLCRPGDAPLVDRTTELKPFDLDAEAEVFIADVDGESAPGIALMDVVAWNAARSVISTHVSLPIQPSGYLPRIDLRIPPIGNPPALVPDRYAQDGTWDVVLAFEDRGIVVLDGTQAGSFVPTPQVTVTEEAPFGVTFELIRPGDLPFGCPIILTADGVDLTLELPAEECPDGPAGDGSVFHAIPYAGAIDDVSLVTGDLVGDSADELVIWLRSIGELHVVGATTAPWGLEELLSVPAPVADPPCGIYIADLDGDGGHDLVTCGDGTISVARPGGYAFADASASLGEVFPLLAVADLDGDGDADFVKGGGEGGIYAGTGGTVERRVGAPASGWIAATTGDFNRDGIADAAVSAGVTNVELLLGSTSGWFTRHLVPTPSRVVRLESGDFDGDRTDDVALVAAPSDLNDELLVLYGDASAPASEVVSMGQVDAVEALHAGFFGPHEPDRDLSAELVVMQAVSGSTQEATRSFLVFLGSSTRQLLAAHLFESAAGPLDVGYILVGGFLRDEPPGVILEVRGDPGDPIALSPIHAEPLLRLTASADAPLVVEPPPGVTFTAAPLLARGDLDADGVDEVLVAVPGWFGVVAVEAGAEEELFTVTPTWRALDFAAPPIAMEVLDMDLDGVEDAAIVTAQGVGGLMGVAGGTLDGLPTMPHATYLSGTAHILSAIVYQPAPGMTAYLAAVEEVVPGSFELFRVRLNDPEATTEEVARFGGLAPIVQPPHLAAGDLTGDHIVDLAVSGSLGPFFFGI